MVHNPKKNTLHALQLYIVDARAIINNVPNCLCCNGYRWQGLPLPLPLPSPSSFPLPSPSLAVRLRQRQQEWGASNGNGNE
jgi:hypothetical protein